jgi:NodT family efflux transporter outer membrane factor (OMF) lipoprotein
MKRTIVMALLVLAGCTAGPNYVRPVAPLPPTWRDAAGPAPDAAPQSPYWWTMFHDPVLDGLETRAMQANLSIEQALARLDQARAAARGAAAAQLPAGTIDAGAARETQSLNAGLGQLSRYVPLFSQIPGAPSGAGLGRTVDNFVVQSGASWDIDFAGGLARQAQAARADAAGAAAGVAAARLSVSADLADAYMAYRGAVAQRAQIAALDAILARQVETMAVRVRLGAAPRERLDALRARAADTAAGLPLLTATIAAERNRIAVLVGASPSLPLPELDVTTPVPVAEAFGAGVPADLLRWRPDVTLAEDRLIAANARIGAALSEYWPKLTLSALIGLNSTAASTLFSGDSGMLQGAAGLHWRLFDFGRVDAEVRSARGATREALAAWRETVLMASEDVETGFVRAQASAARTAILATRRDAQAASTRSADAALATGQISRDADLDAQAALAATEADLAVARSDSARAAIVARRALGH